LLSVETDEANRSAPSPWANDRGSVVGSLSDEEVVEPPAPVKATPAVRSGQETGVDSPGFGTGTDGKITREDVEQAAENRELAATPMRSPRRADSLRGLRRTIAKRMQEARHVPDVTIWEDGTYPIWKLSAPRKKESRRGKRHS
jgi:pyruvate/2-oxoglutarate dehydrogenase complex dihydrolipoamide acyltransferase (E2) component